MQVEIEFLKPRAIALIRNTTKTIGHVLQGVSQEDATTYCDGPGGWTTAEILGHIHDFSVIFYERAVRILNEDNPILIAYDHEQMARDRRYNEQDIQAVYAQIVISFERLAAFYETVQDGEWDRAGLHPEAGPFTLTKSMLQAGTHSALHIEQMTRVLTQKYTK